MPNAFAHVTAAWLARPDELARAWHSLATVSWTAQQKAALELSGASPSPFAEAVEGDDRFEDPAWHENRFYHALMQHYLAFTRTLEQLVYDTPGVAKPERRDAAFWVRHWCNALAPSNFLYLNPQALRRVFDTGGASLLHGYDQWLGDLAAGDLRMVDRSKFKVGVELAPTPGKVVYRNDVMELLHYTPQCPQVRAVPLLFVPPWINKFYILDLNDKRSMVRHLVQQGFDVFIISWRNPGSAQANMRFEDHLFDGILAAIDAARAIANARQVHAIGYCIGGTALATLMAWLNRKHRKLEQVPVAHWTLLASLTDFSSPGDIASFINEERVATLDELMRRQGFLGAGQIGWSFRLLRPNSQIWRYVVHKYLLGEPTPAMAALAWNADGTRQPRATHSFCLHALYLENRLCQPNALHIRGQDIDLGAIRQPLYAVGAVADHITPWHSTYRSAGLLRCPVRFTLTSSGHIMGVINPPEAAARQRFWSGELIAGRDVKTWYSLQNPEPGSWWRDWTAWLHERCGDWRPAPGAAHPHYPWLGEAPGMYVMQP